MDDRALGQIITFFEVVNGASMTRTNRPPMGVWFLEKESLMEFVINNRVITPIKIGITGALDPKAFEKMCENFRVGFEEGRKCNYILKIESQTVYVNLYQDKGFGKLIIAPKRIIETINTRRDMSMSRWGTWKYKMVYNKWFELSIPYKFGTVLDMQIPNWITKVKHIEKENLNKNDSFFIGKRAENALELMALLRSCATVAGIEKYLFLGFGTLLGVAREGGFIPNDRDLDHCVAGEYITPHQEEKFLQEIARSRTIDGKTYSKGLYEGRCRKPVRRRDEGQRFLWTSCGHKKVHGQKGVKSCIWKFFKHEKYDWHSKGRRWINTRKFDYQLYDYNGGEDAIAKGIPTGLLDQFKEIKFHGVTINIPKRVGACLDEWYPGWARPKKGASAKKHVMVIPDWKKPNGWKVY
ncbi:MAG: hypothetical protein GY853_13800 [PVC group bacterium]|nr:hypothetical protein [PVC group bacterium]